MDPLTVQLVQLQADQFEQIIQLSYQLAGFVGGCVLSLILSTTWRG